MKNFYVRNCLLIAIINMTVMSCYGQKRDSKADARWHTGVALYSFNRFSFNDAIAKADSADVQYVEGFSFHKLGEEFNGKTMGQISQEDIKAMKRLMNQKGIRMGSMYVSRAKNADEWKRYFQMGKDFGMQYLVSEPPLADLDMVDSLAGLFNIKVAIHQHSRESGSIYWHPDTVLSAIQNRPNLGVCADLGHWARSGLDPAECLKKLRGHILGIHLKDIDRLHHKAEDVLVGTGVINFPSVVSELKSQKFKGLIYVECEHKWDNNLADVIGAIRYFERVAKTTAK